MFRNQAKPPDLSKGILQNGHFQVRILSTQPTTVVSVARFRVFGKAATLPPLSERSIGLCSVKFRFPSLRPRDFVRISGREISISELCWQRLGSKLLRPVRYRASHPSQLSNCNLPAAIELFVMTAESREKGIDPKFRPF